MRSCRRSRLYTIMRRGNSCPQRTKSMLGIRGNQKESQLRQRRPGIDNDAQFRGSLMHQTSSRTTNTPPKCAKQAPPATGFFLTPYFKSGAKWTHFQVNVSISTGFRAQVSRVIASVFRFDANKLFQVKPFLFRELSITSKIFKPRVILWVVSSRSYTSTSNTSTTIKDG